MVHTRDPQIWELGGRMNKFGGLKPASATQ